MVPDRQTDGQTDIVTPWAPVGAKNHLSLINVNFVCDRHWRPRPRVCTWPRPPRRRLPCTWSARGRWWGWSPGIISQSQSSPGQRTAPIGSQGARTGRWDTLFAFEGVTWQNNNILEIWDCQRKSFVFWLSLSQIVLPGPPIDLLVPPDHHRISHMRELGWHFPQ